MTYVIYDFIWCLSKTQNNFKIAYRSIFVLYIILPKMLIQDMEHIIPLEWDPMNLMTDKFKLVTLHPLSAEYQEVKNMVDVGIYFSQIQGIYRVQNPFLFTKFRLKTYDFEQKGRYEIQTLFHDTSRENVLSIASFNFDWRFGERFKFGPGVYFSLSPFLANKHSSKNNGLLRSMFIAKVLTQNVQFIQGDVFLPDYGYDTVLCHYGETFVKYFDGEYYPQYVVDYVSFPC